MNKNFKISYGYFTQDGVVCGMEQGRVIAQNSLDIMLKMLSPFDCTEWMRRVNSLRRGGYTMIEMTTAEDTKGHGLIKKFLRIER